MITFFMLSRSPSKLIVIALSVLMAGAAGGYLFNVFWPCAAPLDILKHRQIQSGLPLEGTVQGAEIAENTGISFDEAYVSSALPERSVLAKVVDRKVIISWSGMGGSYTDYFKVYRRSTSSEHDWRCIRRIRNNVGSREQFLIEDKGVREGSSYIYGVSRRSHRRYESDITESNPVTIGAR